MSNYTINDLVDITERIELVTVKLHSRLSEETNQVNRRVLMKSLVHIHENREVVMMYINRLKSDFLLTPPMNAFVENMKGRFVPYIEYLLRDVEDPFSLEENR